MPDPIYQGVYHDPSLELAYPLRHLKQGQGGADFSSFEQEAGLSHEVLADGLILPDTQAVPGPRWYGYRYHLGSGITADTASPSPWLVQSGYRTRLPGGTIDETNLARTLQQFCLHFWMNPSQPAGNDRDGVLVRYADNFCVQWDCSPEKTATPALAYVITGTGNGLNRQRIGIAGWDVPRNAWSAITFCCDGATLFLYINGSLYASQTLSGLSIDTFDAAANKPPVTFLHQWVGHENVDQDGGVRHPFGTAAAEFRLYSRHFNNAEVLELYETSIAAAETPWDPFANATDHFDASRSVGYTRPGHASASTAISRPAHSSRRASNSLNDPPVNPLVRVAAPNGRRAWRTGIERLQIKDPLLSAIYSGDSLLQLLIRIDPTSPAGVLFSDPQDVQDYTSNGFVGVYWTPDLGGRLHLVLDNENAGQTLNEELFSLVVPLAAGVFTAISVWHSVSDQPAGSERWAVWVNGSIQQNTVYAVPYHNTTRWYSDVPATTSLVADIAFCEETREVLTQRQVQIKAGLLSQTGPCLCPPFIEGHPIEGSQLTVNPGVWNDEFVTFAYQWGYTIGTAADAPRNDLVGETGATLTVPASLTASITEPDADQRNIYCEVTAYPGDAGSEVTLLTQLTPAVRRLPLTQGNKDTHPAYHDRWFDGDSMDSTGGTYTGAWTGLSPTYAEGPPGHPGSSLVLDGSDYMTVTPRLDFSQYPRFTLFLRFRPNSPAGGALISEHDDSGSETGLAVLWEDGEIYAAVYSNAGGNVFFGTNTLNGGTGLELPTNEWYELAFSFAALSNGNCRAALAVGSLDTDPVLAFVEQVNTTLAGTRVRSNTAASKVGSGIQGGFERTFSGEIADLRLYTRDLTDDYTTFDQQTLNELSPLQSLGSDWITGWLQQQAHEDEMSVEYLRNVAGQPVYLTALDITGSPVDTGIDITVASGTGAFANYAGAAPSNLGSGTWRYLPTAAEMDADFVCFRLSGGGALPNHKTITPTPTRLRELNQDGLPLNVVSATSTSVFRVAAPTGMPSDYLTNAVLKPVTVGRTQVYPQVTNVVSEGSDEYTLTVTPALVETPQVDDVIELLPRYLTVGA